MVGDMVTVLNKVPREMLLIFKTNDCLRGIDSTLRTRFRANAFICMTKCCTSVVFDYKIKYTASFWSRVFLRLQSFLAILAIDLSRIGLRVFSTLNS